MTIKLLSSVTILCTILNHTNAKDCEINVAITTIVSYKFAIAH